MSGSRKTLKNFEIRKAKKAVGYVKGVPCVIKMTRVAPDRWLESKAATAFRLMDDAIFKEMGIRLRVNSAWRSYEHQERLRNAWDTWLANWDGEGPRRPRPARPGYSGHHNGVCVDIQRSHGDLDGDGVNEIDEWLEGNAHHFGFFRTVRSEPWHWEWLGTIT